MNVKKKVQVTLNCYFKWVLVAMLVLTNITFLTKSKKMRGGCNEINI